MTSNSIHSSSCVRALRLSVAIVGLVLIGAPDGAAVGALATSSQPPAGQSTTLLPDGRTLLVGGVGPDGPLATASATNPATGQSVVVGRLRQPRAWHTATLLPDGSVAILGGLDRNGRVVEVAEIFDPMSGAANVLQGDEVPRAYHTATLLPTGNVLIAGGVSGSNAIHSNAEIWDPITDRVIEMLPMRRAHRSHAAVLQSDGGVLISGGAGRNGTTTDGDERFDSVTQSFSDVVVRSSEPELYLSVASPSDGAASVPTTTRIALLFSRSLDVATVNNRTLSLSGTDGIVASLIVPAESGRVVFMTPRTPLRRSSSYTVSVNGVADPSGLAAPASIVNFTTEAEPATGGSGSDDETWIPDATAIRNGWRSGRSTSGWQVLAPLQAAPGVTALTGQVLLLNGRPLADVTLRVEAQTTRTDRSGRFLLTDVPAGRQRLLIDGRSATTAGRTFGVFEARFEIRSGQTNVLPYTIWMPRIDTAHAVSIPSPTTETVVVTTPLIPGLEVHLPKGAVVKDHDGQVARQISITPIPVDQPPFPLPTGVDVPVYFTIQPGGGYLESAGAWPAGARIVYPNYHAERSGTRINFWHYDPAERGWHVYGHGSVRSDGRQIVPDAGTAIYEFTGAMINDGQSPPADGPTPGGPSDGDPVDLGTGLFVYEKTDLALPDVLPLNLIRTYRPNDLVSRPFGIGTTHLYAMFLWSAQQYTEGDLILPDGSQRAAGT